jgi:hypothetical protein
MHGIYKLVLLMYISLVVGLRLLCRRELEAVAQRTFHDRGANGAGASPLAVFANVDPFVAGLVICCRLALDKYVEACRFFSTNAALLLVG